MKRKILVTAMVLGFLGITVIAVRAEVMPSVSAGIDQSIALPTNTVTLTGTATSANGTISTYAWTEVSGPSVAIATPSTVATAINGLTVGSYVFRLTATDVTSMSASDDVMVTVGANPADPTVNAGIAQTITLPISTVTLVGSATASTGRTITGYNWVQTSGPVTSVIATSTTASTTVTGLTTAGNYVYTLTATDSASATATSTITVTVNAPETQTQAKSKMKLEITPSGEVSLQGVLLTNVTGTITVKVWGITFTINTANLERVNGPLKDVTKFAVGDTIRVFGMIDPLGLTPTINAKLIRDVTAQVSKQKEDDRKENEKKLEHFNNNRGNDSKELNHKGDQNEQERGRSDH